MSNDIKSSMLEHERPYCLATGLVALDVIEGQNGVFASVGGSCGNVIAILSFLGWKASPVSRIGDDIAGNFVRNQLESIGVETKFLRKNHNTPVIIQSFTEVNGSRKHRFTFKCSDCGEWFPRYRPTTIEHADEVIKTDEPPNVFFFDRVSPVAIKLAKWTRICGGLVLFEPSSIGDHKIFEEAIAESHILKFADDRIGNVDRFINEYRNILLIKLRGADGLEIKWKSEWRHFKSFAARNFTDASGSGDWCTAGLLSLIGANGSQIMESLTFKELSKAIRYGQALATLNCGFEGARGAMDVCTKEEVDNLVLAIYSERDLSVPLSNSAGFKKSLPQKICNDC